MSLGEKIREQRKQAGLSQEQLAVKLNVSRQAITKWETDKGIPDVANLIAISDEFGLSLDELIKGNVAVKRKSLPIAPLRNGTYWLSCTYWLSWPISPILLSATGF